MAKSTGLKNFIQTRLVYPIVNFLKQGLSPSLLAEAITWGILFGIIPLLGTTTALCAVTSVIRKINMAAIQLVNWLVYPLQLLFYIPFIKLGGWIMHAPIPLSISQVKEMIETDFMAFLRLYAKANIGAVIVWLIISLILGLFLHKYLKIAFTKIAKEKNRT